MCLSNRVSWLGKEKLVHLNLLALPIDLEKIVFIRNNKIP